MMQLPSSGLAPRPISSPRRNKLPLLEMSLHHTNPSAGPSPATVMCSPPLASAPTLAPPRPPPHPDHYLVGKSPTGLWAFQKTKMLYSVHMWGSSWCHTLVQLGFILVMLFNSLLQRRIGHPHVHDQKHPPVLPRDLILWETS